MSVLQGSILFSTHVILQETQRLMQEPVPGISAVPDESNARYFKVVVAGPEGSTVIARKSTLAMLGIWSVMFPRNPCPNGKSGLKFEWVQISHFAFANYLFTILARQTVLRMRLSFTSQLERQQLTF